jgi:RNA polymerase sigma-70 factor (ECF subfamily)
MGLNATELGDFVSQITRHQTMLRAYIISLMPGLDGADDVLQEVNVVLWEKRETFEPGTNFRAWACAIARFMVKSHRRKAFREGKVVLDEKILEKLEEHGRGRSGREEERLRALERCLGDLGEDERRLVEHHYFSKIKLEEFAALHNRSVGSLRVALFRIRAALRKCINGKLVTSPARS